MSAPSLVRSLVRSLARPPARPLAPPLARPLAPSLAPSLARPPGHRRSLSGAVAPDRRARRTGGASRRHCLVAALSLGVAVALSACGERGAPPADRAAPDDALTTAPAASDTAPTAVAAFPASDDAADVDHGVCPFECCRYGRWTTTAAVVLRERPDSAAPPGVTLAAGTTVDVPSGEVHVIPGRFVVQRAVAGFAAGDTLAVFSPTGEGHYRVRRAGTGGALVDAGLESPDPGCPAGRASCVGTFSRPPRTTWWVEVVGPGPERGWTADVAAFEGKDSCA